MFACHSMDQSALNIVNIECSNNVYSSHCLLLDEYIHILINLDCSPHACAYISGKAFMPVV